MEKVAEKQKKNKFLCEFLRFPDTNTGFAGELIFLNPQSFPTTKIDRVTQIA
jgi:hypothetical protein